MALVNVLDVNVLDNPTSFTNPFQFEITFECLKHLPSDLEWKVVYVGSASDGKFDQELDSVLVGPIPVGVNKFVFHANAPDPSKIPRHDLLGVTVVMVTCFYRNQEFIRIGYYVNNELCDENVSAASNMTSKTDDDNMEVDEDHMELAPDEDSNSRPVELSKNADVAKIRRNILAAKPRVTRYIINWDDDAEEATTTTA